ncbi:MAG: hypothetical protein L0I76_03680 [Pseudonocardia sp.]|nr:hypothetical protein [Pseudonocardia sp.]
MSKVVLGVAQIVGVIVLALFAVGLVIGLVQWAAVAAVIIAVPVGCWWLYKNVSGRRSRARAAVPKQRKPVDGPPAARRAELESRATLDAVGRCGWCGSSALHKDEFGFPSTPLAHHRKEIDAML